MAFACHAPIQGGVASDEPVYTAGVSTLIIHEDLSWPTSLSDWGASSHGATPRVVPLNSPSGDGTGTVDPTRYALGAAGSGWNGSGRYGRIIYDGSTQNGPALYGLAMPSTAGTKGTAPSYFQWHMRVTPDTPFTTTVAHKFFLARHWVDSNNLIGWQTHDHIGSPGTTNPSNQLTYWHPEDDGHITTNQGQQPVGPWFNDLADGQWHRVTAAYKCHTSSGNKDGYHRLWIDGVKVVDVSQATAGVTPPGGEKVWCDQEDVDALYVADGVGTELYWGVTQTSYVTPAWTEDMSDFYWWTT